MMKHGITLPILNVIINSGIQVKIFHFPKIVHKINSQRSEPKIYDMIFVLNKKHFLIITSSFLIDLSKW